MVLPVFSGSIQALEFENPSKGTVQNLSIEVEPIFPNKNKTRFKCNLGRDGVSPVTHHIDVASEQSGVYILKLSSFG